MVLGDMADGLGAEAFQILTEKFGTLDSVGPQSAADVAEETGLDREQAQQAAFQDAQDLFLAVQSIRLENLRTRDDKRG